MSPPQSPNSSRDQVRPLAPSSHRIHVENEEGVNYTSATSNTELSKKRRRRRCVKCFACCGVTTVIVGIVILILALTVFKAKDPKIRMNSIRFEGLSFLTRSSNLQPNLNITVVADISIKNPNSVSFKFRAATAGVSYSDRVIAEALIPRGSARARRTLRMDVSVTVMTEKLVGIPRLTNDLIAMELPISMSTNINGRVNLGLFKKSVGVRMNCNMVIDLQRQQVKGNMDCDRKVSM
ncbi:hypothetical protein FXO38_15387 [Capsicum annuum]|uniref:Late embryogenesis abundant protein LEA-2 subgroup domain-containing protein n=1 Tax=Capsicum annuum TaxID=4072 RepID=A0A2G3AP59_CAPAN|nr:uncharacterized protein LOC107853024 [Capsicum annuum]KAF3653958.1 hypothetical protein FXO38_15387 [Capsicum annuum]PHT96022.1 hypothetical protein T459_03904 [Capsicum annuum]